MGKHGLLFWFACGALSVGVAAVIRHLTKPTNLLDLDDAEARLRWEKAHPGEDYPGRETQVGKANPR